MFSKIKHRLALRRLDKSLRQCTIDDLKRAAALNNWLRETSLLPGDKVTLFFDGLNSTFGVERYQGANKSTSEFFEEISKEIEK